jgi:serine/threonine-protein kinase
MLYEMATGVVPFEGASFQLLVKHAFEEPVPPGQRNPDVYVPRALDELIMELLRKAPEARPTADVLLARLGRLAVTLGERERSRGRELLEGRAARMIDTVRPLPGDAEMGLRATAVPDVPSGMAHAPGARVLAIVGALDDEIAVGLRANGLPPLAVNGPPIPPGVVAFFAPSANADTLRALVAFGLPVLTDAAADDVERVAQMVSLGVADVVPLPLRVETLASKVQRALKKHARRAR